MNTPARSSAAQRWTLRAIGASCIALVAGALMVQLVLHEDPCPLCIIQRYLFLLIAVFSFAGSVGGRRAGLWQALALSSALAGAGVAVRHVYVQAHPGFSCGADALQPVVDGLPPAHWLPLVFKVGGLCETSYPPILGLSLPMWALAGFSAIAVVVGWRMRLHTVQEA
ncbi:disulfide bond formation protein B [Burkholderia stagnalis]|uniref:disulfide bond formation protein B n=1 Tax=Burkholderia stagnalis TaxID=1503054 RepID=UPI000756099F|nr:disulfide bond formation protein B [Burkholderia stagnalis]KVN02709.1 disulfide bond formation protein B [Burkholderia stagnalis]KWE06814.1 disulfide bond formation protein B [Burkholderia stagnalis]KWE11573.1 disulfide bond formation protein B [Burkholderia stagnalis]KWO88525.1 disulfide bond formation protein B [Burkholderia stagnalis]